MHLCERLELMPGFTRTVSDGHDEDPLNQTYFPVSLGSGKNDVFTFYKAMLSVSLHILDYDCMLCY